MTRCWIFLLGAVAIVPACADGSTAADGTDPNATPADSSDAGTDTSTTTPPPPPSDDAGNGFDAAPAEDAAPKKDGAVSLACGKTFDFEGNDGGFTHAPLDGASGASFDPWTNGAAGGALACHSGTSCFATTLAGPYAQCQRAELRSPVIDLSSCAGAGTVQVTFWHAYDFLGYTDAAGTTYYDGGIVEMSGDGGATWQTAVLSPPSVGNLNIAAKRGIIGEYACPGPSTFYVQSKSGFINQSTAWTQVEADVPAALRTSQFVFRFAYASGKSTADGATALASSKPGWHVDDVAVVVK